MSTTPLRPGDVVGHYRIEHVVGVGGMGVVYGARDLRLDRQVALKVMLAHGATSELYLERFQREADVLARLDSPHVVQIFEHGRHGDFPYLVTQYAAGGDLGHRLRERGPMPLALALRVAAQVADALVAAHEVGVVHRDVKPANVLLRDAGLDRLDRLHVYLGDFGVAGVEESGLTQPGAMAGTWSYLAPERTRGAPGSPASDVYAVGCLLHECLTGRPPYTGSDVEVAMQHVEAPVPALRLDGPVGADVDRVLARCLAKEPADRFPTAEALRDELRDLERRARDGDSGSGTGSGVHGVVGAFGGGAGSSPGGSPGSLPGGASGGSHAGTGSGIGPGVGGLPGGGATGRRGTRGLRALAAVVAVLVVVAAVLLTVVLTQDGGGTPTAGGSSTATDPTSRATGTDPPEEPAVVRGDVDGDGYGDLVLVSYEDSVELRSTGSRLRAPQPRPDLGSFTVVGDLEGDGVPDTVVFDGYGDGRTVEVVAGTAKGTRTLLQLPTSLDGFSQELLVGDVTGDGRDDLLFATSREGRSSVVVARSLGDGRFGRGRVWYRGRLDDSYPLVGDVDGDGLVDVVDLVDDYEDDDFRARVLQSTGDSFRARTARVGDSILYAYYRRLADIDGDGVEELVLFDDFDDVVRVSRFRDGRFETPRVVWSGSYDIDKTAVSDLDGDGDDDVVLMDEGRIRVLVSTQGALTPDPSWNKKTKPFEALDVLDTSRQRG